MPSNNLGAPRIASGAATNQHATSNDGDNWLDSAITEPITVVCESTTVTVTATEFATNVTFKLIENSPPAGGAITFNVPSTNALGETLKRGLFAVINDTTQDVTVQISGQSETPPTLTSGQRSILVMDGSDVYLAVPQGTVGADGVSAGVRWKFDTSTNTASDPGSGDLRLNNGTLSSVTEVGISDNAGTTGNPDASAWLATFDDSTASTKGHMIISKASAPENFAIYAVTAATDATTHWRFTVSHVASDGSFSASDNLAVQFVPKGNVGAGSTIAVEDSGQSPSSINAATETLIFGDGLTASDNGDGSVTVTGGGTFSGALVTRTTDQSSVDYSSGAAIPFDGEEYDTDSYHNTGTNPSRVTAPSDGKYFIAAGVVISSILDGTWAQMKLTKNGSNFRGAGYELRDATGGNHWRGQVVSADIDLVAGDYIEAHLTTESDTSITISGTTETGTWMCIKKVS